MLVAGDDHVAFVADEYNTQLAWVGNPPGLGVDAVGQRHVDIDSLRRRAGRDPRRFAAGHGDLRSAAPAPPMVAASRAMIVRAFIEF